jgi:hypothetical protein
MAPTKHKPQQQIPNNGASIAGPICIVIGIFCLIFAVNSYKVFAQLNGNMDTAGEDAEGFDAIGQIFASLLIFSSVGVESLALAIVFGITGVILILIGLVLWIVGAVRFYGRD